MSQNQYDFDVIIIGAGAGGSSVGFALAESQPKLRIAMVEGHKLGGTCLNYGCDPTKTMLEVARLLHQSHQAARYGLELGPVSFDWAGVQGYVRQVQTQLLGGSQEEAQQNIRQQGIELFIGEAKFTGSHEIIVTSPVNDSRHNLRAANFVIATGTRSADLPVPGLKEAGYITNVEAVQLTQLPKRLAIIGGGPIGIEFSQLFKRFGVEVTVLEHSDTLLSTEDQELVQILVKTLHDEGIRLLASVEMQRVQTESDGGKRLTFKVGEGEAEDLVVDEILVAAGRTPNIESLNLATVGLATTEDGIKVDKYLRSTVPHIWAVGDVAGGYQFTHVAEAQAEVVVHNLVKPKELQSFEERITPWVTYTDPEFAHVGQTEEQLKKSKTDYTVLHFDFAEVERAKINNEKVGGVKLLIGGDKKILGGHILGSTAGEMIASVVLAMNAGLTIDQLAAIMLPYPTRSQAIQQAAKQ